MSNNEGGLLHIVEPILGYILGIAVVILITTLTFYSPASSQTVYSAQVMSQFLTLVAFLVGIAAVSRAANSIDNEPTNNEM